jgi:hypothetical protein
LGIKNEKIEVLARMVNKDPEELAKEKYCKVCIHHDTYFDMYPEDLESHERWCDYGFHPLGNDGEICPYFKEEEL